VKIGWDAHERGAAAEAAWQQQFDAYTAAHPAESAEFTRRMAGALPATWAADSAAFIDKVNSKAESIASRKASQNALDGYGPMLPELLGGSADLAGSNNTLWSGSVGIQDDAAGNYIYYGVREFGMAGIMNGLVLHGGFKSYGATFLMFSEYARNALRMAALMKLPGLFVFTHDSIGLGEDGPTHQPVEQTATLRLMPNMSVWRPADAVESAIAWQQAIERTDGPTSLIFTRQGLPHQTRTADQMANVARGGYVLKAADKPAVTIIATGSEVGLAMNAANELESAGTAVNVVSMPSTDRFDQQDSAYRASVLPNDGSLRVALEAGVTDGWYKYVGLEGLTLGLDTFGESGPAAKVFEHFGLTATAVAGRISDALA